MRFVFLPEIESPFLNNMDERRFGLLKEVVARGKRFLWVTSQGKDGKNLPESNIIA